MPLRDLTPAETAVIGCALQRISEGDILAGFEFGARIGVELDEFRKLLCSWPNWDDTKDDSPECLAINNTLNDLLHGVGLSDQQCRELLQVEKVELLRIYRKWAASRGWNATGVK